MLYHIFANHALVTADDVQNESAQQFFAVCFLSNMPLVLASIASTLHLIAISINRCLSLKFPIQHKVRLTKR